MSGGLTEDREVDGGVTPVGRGGGGGGGKGGGGVGGVGGVARRGSVGGGGGEAGSERGQVGGLKVGVPGSKTQATQPARGQDYRTAGGLDYRSQLCWTDRQVS